MSHEMSLMGHIAELRNRLLRIFIAIMVIMTFSLTFGIKQVRINDTNVYLPIPNPFDNLSMQLLRKVIDDIIPPFVEPIVTAPAQGFVSMIIMALFIAVILSSPVWVREISGFIGPALYETERKLIVGLIIPSSILFASGVIFSYIFVTPFIVDFLYRYALPIGVTTFISITDMISFVLLFLLAFGASFQLPVIMYALTISGIVEPNFWKKNARYALIIIIIFGAVITPDGSGITMWFVAAPMLALYGGAYLVIRRKIKVTPKVPEAPDE
ncbi:MAG: twin-arginine translocase subunit TatC [Thaumarchaeota archaeon]|nr:twin-arginine translocase subunit TatC [Nitrososphaerota archaeon]